MTIRETTQLVTAHRQSEGGGFIVRRPFPTSGLSEIDPFLLLDEMGPADYAPGEAVGAPDHPQRGFETVTYMLEGEFEHEDSAGHRGMIRPGDVQWMTAAGGIVHSEMPSRAIRDNGGHVHGFQLWVNLPACLKMSRPRYQEVPAAGIPEGRSADGRARVIAGEALGARAVIDTHIPIVYQDWSLDADADVTVAVAADTRAFVYVFRGAVQVGDRGTMVKDGQLALLGVGDAVRLRGTPEGGRFLLLAGLRSASGGTLRTFRHEHKRGAAAGRARLSNRKHGRNHTERANIMSWLQTNEPRCTDPAAIPAIEKVIEARSRDLGGFTVGRLLPSAARKLVGPFIFFDHMGPAELAPGQGLDVRPHPHINLATVTYLFEGEIVHRDSLGTEQPIRPGAINWMTAGRGIVHSERTGAQMRKTGSRVHGLQLWVALPQAREEDQPDFHHYPADTLPALDPQGARVRVLIGTAYGVTSPVRTRSPLFYADAQIRLGGELALPSEHAERAAYVVSGAISCGVERIEAARMIIFAPGSAPVLRAETDARVMLIGGAPLDGERHIWWNFVSSSKERLEQVKREWKQGPVTSALEGRFPQVPGETEFIPLPEGL